MYKTAVYRKQQKS